MGGLRAFFTAPGGLIRLVLILQTATIILLLGGVFYLAQAVETTRHVASAAESSADDAHSAIGDIADGTTSVSCNSGG